MNPETTQARPSGRRRATPAPGRRPVRRSDGRLPRPPASASAWAALAVAALGALLVLLGGLRSTVLAPPAVSVATLTAPRTAVVSTAVGLLGLDGPRLEVQATAAAASTPVFVGIGRAHDVDAYLARVRRLEVVGDDAGALLTRSVGSEPALTDPAGADVWLVSARGPGAAGLVWPDTPGQWRLVVATDGTAPAARTITMSWSGREHRTAAPALISIGLVLVVGGLITRVMLGSRSRLETDR